LVDIAFVDGELWALKVDLCAVRVVGEAETDIPVVAVA